VLKREITIHQDLNPGKFPKRIKKTSNLRSFIRRIKNLWIFLLNNVFGPFQIKKLSKLTNKSPRSGISQKQRKSLLLGLSEITNLLNFKQSNVLLQGKKSVLENKIDGHRVNLKNLKSPDCFFQTALCLLSIQKLHYTRLLKNTKSLQSQVFFLFRISSNLLNCLKKPFSPDPSEIS